MKWKISRLLVALVLALQFQLFGFWFLPGSTPAVLATSDYADVTVTYSITFYGAAPPTAFWVTRIDDTNVQIDWVPAPNTQNTTIIMKVNAIPENINDGYIVYTGNATTATDKFLDLDVIWSKVYYAAFSSNGSDWSADYIYDYTESPYVEEVANNLSFLGTLSTAVVGILCLGALLVISIFAFWKENHLLFIIAFGLAYVTGLNTPDIISGNSETTNMGLAIGALLIVYAVFCAGMSIRLMFWEGRE